MMNKQVKREQANLMNSHWKGMTSSIQPLSHHYYEDRHRNGGPRTRAADTRDPYAAGAVYGGTRGDVYAVRHSDMYGIPQLRSSSDSSRSKESNGGGMFNTLGRKRSKDHEQRGRYDNAREEDDLRRRETAFPPKDVYFDKVRSRDTYNDDLYHAEESRKFHTLQPRDVRSFNRYSGYEDKQPQRSPKGSTNKVPEDLYKAVQKTPNEHIFAQYGKEIRRVVVPTLPMPLDRLLERVVQVYNDTLTRDMVPLKAIYIQDPQTKIFYQLDDPSDVTKGSHIKIHEEFLLSNIDRGSSQSLEDLHNSSNSSISSGGGGFVIPTAPAPKPIIKRPGRSRLSLVEEGLSLIRNEVNNIKSSETGSTVSSQTDFAVQTTAAAVPADVPQLHDMIRKLHGNLLEAKSELAALRRRELETRGDMETIIRSTSSEIARHIEASLPRGIRRKRMEADEVEQRYRNTSERTYSNIKDLEKTVEVMKTDVVKRKVKLDPVQLERMESELLSYTEQVTFMNDTFTTLKESLKSVMKEELEIIVNEEQFLEDEEPMLEEVTIKCEELTKIMETLRKVAAMQRQQGTTQLNIYTASEYDILEERSNVIQAIATLVPNHEERIQSIQATEEFRAAQKRFVKSESDFIAEEIQQKSQTLRKTNAFEELERKRDEALRQMYTAQPPPHKFGRKSSQPQFSSQTRKASIGKSKSMSSIAHFDSQDAQDYRHYADGASDDDVTPSHAAAAPPATSHQITRSRSFSEKEKQQSSEDEKTKKKTMFAGFFSKKSKSKQEADLQKSNGIDDVPDEAANGDVYVVDTAKMQQRSESPSPQTIPRSNTDASNLKKNSKNNKTKANRTTSFSVESDKNRNKKGKNR